MDSEKIKSTIKRDSDGTITLTITLALADVKKLTESEIEREVKNITLPGFREGKAPRNLAEKHLDKEKIREEVLKKLLPDAYLKAVTEHNLKPIINPKIHVEKIEDDADWTITAKTCETPAVNLNNYKEAVKKITAKSKIVIPGKEQKPVNFEEIEKAMLENISIDLPAILVEGELERLLAQLLSEIKALGLTLDQYLASTGKSVESLKKENETKAKNDLKFEFALQKIAETEKITVDQKEIDEAIQKAKDETERGQLQQNMYLLANILRQQKTLDFIKNL